MNLKLYIEDKVVDLFQDESVQLTSKLSDIEKLSNVFTDFSDSFTVPATANNNQIFKHYYDVDVDNTFNANIKVLAYIELGTLPFRVGTLQLESIKVKKGIPNSYKITYYGGLTQLSDLFGNDLIGYLDYKKQPTGELVKTWDSLSKYDFDYTEENFYKTINNPSFYSGSVITPLIAYADRDWNYGTADSTDIATDSGKILNKELKPAIKLLHVFEAMETKYGIRFSRQFLGSATFNNIYLWCNGLEKNTFDVPLSGSFTLTGGSSGVNYVTSITSPGTVQITSNGLANAGDLVQVALYWPFSSGGNLRAFDDSEFVMQLNIVDLRPGSEGNVLYSTFENFDSNSLHYFSHDFSASELGLTPTNPLLFKLEVTVNKPVTWDSVRFQTNFTYLPPLDMFTYYYTLNNAGEANIPINFLLPKIKVSELLQGIMKMFKLIIRPITSNIFYLNTLDGYYSEGSTLDITDYTDMTEVNIERPLIYKDITFNFEKTNNVLGRKYRELNDPIDDTEGYGDLQATYDTIDSKDKLEVKVPFENMLFERLTIQPPLSSTQQLTDITIGQSVSTNDTYTTFSKNQSKPILFFNNGINSYNDTPIKISFRGGTTNTISSSYSVGNTNDNIISQVTDTLNFGAEVDPWHGTTVQNSLYLNYWSNWIDTIYDLKQRKFTYDAILPERFVEELSLNDALIIGNTRYRINDYKIDLATGKTSLTLFKDIYSWNKYSFPVSESFTGGTFTPSGSSLYFTDYSGDNSIYMYGSFTNYSGSNSNYIVKVLPNGQVDTTFNVGTGLNSAPFSFSEIHAIPGSSKVAVSGYFTSYSGSSANRIARINSNGTLDTTFNIGTGFNNGTNGIAFDSLGNLYVAGVYSSYSGSTANKIAKITPSGSLDTTFNSGTGFNNSAIDVIVNSDDSTVFTGYFSSYSGSSVGGIVKLTKSGSIDTNFNAGGGFNTYGIGNPNGVLNTIDNKILAYGYFTQYSGSNVNRIAKINQTGDLDSSFLSGSGFNNFIYSAKNVQDKFLIQGTFTTYNNVSSSGAIVLNNDGTIYSTFDTSYKYIFGIDEEEYDVTLSGVLTKPTNNTLFKITPNQITTNAGMKYYGCNIITDTLWTTDVVDYGYGTDWVTIMTPSGDSSSECVIRVEEKTNQPSPQLYNTRIMGVKVISGGKNIIINITQNGLGV